MNSTIDRAVQIEAFESIRAAARPEPGTEISFRLASGCVDLEPVPLTVSLERRGHLVVVVPSRKPQMSEKSEIEDAIAALRNTESDGDAIWLSR